MLSTAHCCTLDVDIPVFDNFDVSAKNINLVDEYNRNGISRDGAHESFLRIDTMHSEKTNIQQVWYIKNS